jgi:outer membrane protein
MNMTKFLKSIAIVSVMFFSFGSLNAQKIAHLNYDSLLNMMPQMDSVKKVSADFIKQLEAQLTAMQNDLQTKYADYQKHTAAGDWTDLIKQVKEKELQDLQQRIQDFQQSAQQEIQKKNEELSKPINEKAHKAIKEVAMEKGYKMVLDSGLDNVLYSEPSDDIMPLVKAKLKIK